MSSDLKLLKQIRDDLLKRGEIDSKYVTIVDLGASLWRRLNNRIKELENKTHD